MPYLELDDVKIYYVIVGDLNDNTKSTMVFLHGGAGMADHSIYIPFWSRLSSHINIVFYDQRGCGRSSSGSEDRWNLRKFGRDVLTFCEKLKINNPIVAGVSWGGYIALSYATQFPDHPLALILCNTEAKISPTAHYNAFLRIANQKAANAVRAFDNMWNQFTNDDYFEYCLPFYAKKTIYTG